jgi:hypothetical protein
MFLKNYTSDIPVSQTAYRIEQVLIKCGAAGIAKEYAPAPPGTIAALSFQIETPTGKISIRLPVAVDRAWQALWLDYADGDKLTPDGQQIFWNPRKKKVRADFKEQAERTAWKIIQDWVEVQMSMIQLKQADTLEVFLPYVYRDGQTTYQRLVASGCRGLLPETTT